MKLSPEQKAKRRAARSAFTSRMVDEFKKVAFIALFFILVGGIVWCLILMGQGLTVNYLLPLGFSGSLVTIFGVYCVSSTSAKKSLNDNGLVKNKDGTITKIIEAASTMFNKDSGAAG